MKICFFSHSSSKLGAERSLLEMIDALREHGVECYVILPSRGPLIKELYNRGITYFIFPYRWWATNSPTLLQKIKSILLNIISIGYFSIKLKRWRCNIIISNTIVICIGAFVAKILKKPHVWYIRELGFEHLGFSFHLGENISIKLIKYLSKICITNSYTVAEKFKKNIPPLKIKILYQSVVVNHELNDNLQIDNSFGIRCIVVGSLQEPKRQEDAIRATAILNKRGIRAELNIVGGENIDYKNYLERIVINNNLTKQINFIGIVDNSFPLIQNTDIVLVCSRDEAFGRVTIEAMKAGKPVIGAMSGCTPELIHNGFNGLLYNVMDSNDLADKIEYLYNHPEIAQLMGENGKKWANERFNQGRYGNELISILEPLLKSK